MMIEEAVEEILLLVKQTRIDEGGGDGDPDGAYLFAGLDFKFVIWKLVLTFSQKKTNHPTLVLDPVSNNPIGR